MHYVALMGTQWTLWFAFLWIIKQDIVLDIEYGKLILIVPLIDTLCAHTDENSHTWHKVHM